MAEFFIDDFMFPQLVSASADPTKVVRFASNNSGDRVDEKCIVELENQKLLFVRYFGSTENTGLTESIEFDGLYDANKFFTEIS